MRRKGKQKKQFAIGNGQLSAREFINPNIYPDY